MSRSFAVLLGVLGALLFSVTLTRAHWMSVAHLSTQEQIVSGLIATLGFLVMVVAFFFDRSAAVIIAEVVSLLIVSFCYHLAIRISARSPMKRTMSDLRTIATALEARATDVDEYPIARNLDELASFIEPTYIRHMPRLDGYRNAFRYEAWQIDPHYPGPDHFAIASAGHDWEWEKRSLRDYSTRATTDFDCDIVYSDGRFVSYPDDGSSAATQWPQQQTTTDPKALFEEATSLYRANRFKEAIPPFERVLQANPNDALANARIGICLGEEGRLQESIPHLLKACALDPADYQSRSNLGLVYEKLNRPEEGIDWERQAAKIKPDDAALLNNLGWVLMRAGHNTEAITALERAVHLAPKESLYRENLQRARQENR